jgi:hypothetical protein
MSIINSQPPTSNFQLPKGTELGVGSW